MISVLKNRSSTDCGEAVGLVVERKDDDYGGRLRIIYLHLLVWEAIRMRLQNAVRLVDYCNQ